jgi:hypothetical protein
VSVDCGMMLGSDRFFSSRFFSLISAGSVTFFFL